MGAFVNTNLFTIVNWNDFPDKDSIYFDSYWDEVNKYCREGYSVGGVKITGRHFWYLNFWWIYGLDLKIKRKTIIRPRFTELDYERYWVIQRMFDEQKNLLLVKGRQNGSSETMAGGVIGYDFNFFPASQSVILSGLETYAHTTMKNVFRGLNKLSNTEYYKMRQPDSIDYIKAQYDYDEEDENGKKIKKFGGYQSEVYMKVAYNNPQAASSLSPSLVLYEEAATWKKNMLFKTHEFIEPSLRAENVKTGYEIYIATGGEQGDSIDDVEYMFYHPDEFDLLTFDNSRFETDEIYDSSKTAYFIPAWKYEILDGDGNIMKDESVNSLLKTRAKKTGNALIREKTQKPFRPSEAFMITSGGFFPSSTIEILNNRRTEILKDRVLRDIGRRVKLYWVLNDDSEVEYIGKNRKLIKDIIYKDDPDGPVMIYEPPFKDGFGHVPQLLYRGATDSYDRDEAETSSSKGSSHIRKTFINIKETSKMWVADLFMRPDQAEKFYEYSCKLHYLYNALNLIEYSNLRIFDWYIANGFEYLLRERPYLAQTTYIKQSKVNNRYGVDPALKVHALSRLADMLSVKENVDKIYSVAQLSAFIKFRLKTESGKKYNCDITMSSAWSYLHEIEDENLMLIHSERNKEQNSIDIFPGYVVNKKGKLVMI